VTADIAHFHANHQILTSGLRKDGDQFSPLRDPCHASGCHQNVDKYSPQRRIPFPGVPEICRKARGAYRRNPVTGAAIKIPAAKVAKLSAGAGLKKAVNKK
jgi:hypothetical protein